MPKRSHRALEKRLIKAAQAAGLPEYVIRLHYPDGTVGEIAVGRDPQTVTASAKVIDAADEWLARNAG